jgi:hypothetical protein
MRYVSGVVRLFLVAMVLLLFSASTAWATDDDIEDQPPLVSDVGQSPGDTSQRDNQVPAGGDAPADPTITVWYGETQYFGQLGNPQEQINILGNVRGASDLDYSLNGGPFLPLTIGKGGNNRLVNSGDFNIEIYTDDLQAGDNTVEIRANNQEPGTIVTVNYTPGNTWPLPYYIDWSTVDGFTQVVQVVDGEWNSDNSGIRVSAPGYDRLLAIGDLTWTDFQVTVPITVHDWPVENEGGVGILARWQGHFQRDGEQPGTGWWNMGAYGYYRHRSTAEGGSKLAILTGHYDRTLDESGFKVNRNRAYNFKMRVQTKAPGLSGFYSFKVWEDGDSEPLGWTFEVQDAPPDETFNGSLLLVAHEVDATFGDVEVLPVLEVNASVSGNGTVQVDPELSGVSDAYLYGDEITLTATPAPGWGFEGWSGGLSGRESPAQVILTDDLDVTASFAEGYGLYVDVTGNGEVIRDPDSSRYEDGTVVTLTPSADAGWAFDKWNGPDGDKVTDNGNGTWSIVMDGDIQLTAVFVQAEYDVAVAIDPVGTGTVDNRPGNPYFYGDVATLEPIPETGWHFAGWTGPDADQLVDNGDGTWSLTVDGPKALTASFTDQFRVLLPLLLRSQ